MLYQAKAIHGYKLNGRDGEIGKIKEFYFDDHYWTIRYLVADSGNWLTNRQVLISPHALGVVNKDAQTIAINLTKKQIEDSPPLSSDEPVSRQFEQDYYSYYMLPSYWDSPFMQGQYSSPPTGMSSRENSRNLTLVLKLGIPIYAALMPLVAITSKSRMEKLAMSRIL